MNYRAAVEPPSWSALFFLSLVLLLDTPVTIVTQYKLKLGERPPKTEASLPIPKAINVGSCMQVGREGRV